MATGMKIGIYLSFDGRCAEAFAFYAGILGGTVDIRQTYGQTTLADDMAPEEWGRVMHARLLLGDGQEIIGSDAPAAWRTASGGYAVAIEMDDPAAAARAFASLAAGGTVRLAYAPTFWSAGFGLLVDRYGVQWMVNCTAPVPAPVPAPTPAP